MKILFIGSLINSETLDDIVIRSKVKPSNAPVNFQNMLVKGICEAGADVTIFSLPTVNTFPGGCLPAWGARKERLDFGKEVRWMPCINLLFVKQFCVSVNSYLMLLNWLIYNRKEKDKIVMNYSVYPPYSKATQVMGRLFKTKTCCIVSDLPKYLYKMHDSSGLKAWLSNYYSMRMEKLQTGFDLYVLLTRHMAERMGIEGKPSIVLEGFSDASIFRQIGSIPKSKVKSVMYAGALSKSFNVKAMLDGFMKTKDDYELWLFGYGDLLSYIEECEKKDKRIHYFGKVERQLLLEYMKATHLLLSVKSPDEDHANYAFPSKILEYMTSGTAVASTRVGGIPDEYFEYIFPINGYSDDDIGSVIDHTLSLPGKELFEVGRKSAEYAMSAKSYRIQGGKLVSFLYKGE